MIHTTRTKYSSAPAWENSRAGAFAIYGSNGMHILEDLYTGNVRPGERSFRQNSQYSRALTQAVESGDALSKSLTEEQKKLFEE